MKKSFLIVILLSVGFTFAQKLDRTKPPVAGPAPEIKIGKYESFQLDNGLKVFVVENHKLPLVTFNLIIDRDPILEKENTGYVEAAGELLKTGTKTKTKSQIDEDIDFIGATFSTSSTNLFGSCLKKHTDKLLDVMSDVLLNADFKQEELDKIKERTISELKSEKDEPASIASKVMKKVFYGEGHPYAESETESTVAKVTLEMCRNYYNTFFKPNISYLSIVGDITLDEAKSLTEKYFGNWQKGNVPKYKYEKVEPPLTNKVVFVDRPNSVQSKVIVGYPVDLPKNSPDVILANVTNTILGGGVFRLFENLREKHAYTYGAYSSLSSDEIIGRFTAYADVRNSVTDSAITEILYEMKRIRKDTVDDKELQKAKNYLIGSFSIALEDPKTVANFAINIERWNLPKDFYTNYLKNVAAATPNDILTTAKKYILPENSYILVVGKADELTNKLKNFSFSNTIFYDVDGNKIDLNSMKIPEGITAEKIIDKYIQAIGGKEKLSKVQDRTITMSAKVLNYEVTSVSYQKAPNKLLQQTTVMGFEQSVLYDGTKGYQKSIEGEQEISGNDLEQLKFEAELKSIYDYKSLDVSATVTALVKINLKDAYKVQFSLPNGARIIKYFDAETGFIVKEERNINTPQGTISLVMEMEDYREVDGIKYPFKVIQNIGGMNAVFNVTSVKTNTGLTDSIFEIK